VAVGHEIVCVRAKFRAISSDDHVYRGHQRRDYQCQKHSNRVGEIMDISQMAAQWSDLQLQATDAELFQRDAEKAGMLRAEAIGIEKQLKAAGYDLRSLVVL
jgi:hypothetical protein